MGKTRTGNTIKDFRDMGKMPILSELCDETFWIEFTIVIYEHCILLCVMSHFLCDITHELCIVKMNTMY